MHIDHILGQAAGSINLLTFLCSRENVLLVFQWTYQFEMNELMYQQEFVLLELDYLLKACTICIS